MENISEKELTPDQILKYIEFQWKDIHHTRNQEWTALSAIGSIFFWNNYGPNYRK